MNTHKLTSEVDFIESKPFTQEEERLLSEYLQKQKAIVVRTATSPSRTMLQRKKVLA
jgi:dTDP-4-amino-4,6-dideoxygalactose transaminase